jgi:hypothetical protein
MKIVPLAITAFIFLIEEIPVSGSWLFGRKHHIRKRGDLCLFTKPTKWNQRRMSFARTL